MQAEQKGCDVNIQKVICTGNDEDLPASLKISVNKIAKKEGYSTYKLLNRTLETEGGSFLAVLYDVRINGVTQAGDTTTNIFIKYGKNKDNDNFKVASILELYRREVLFYTEVSKLFTALQDEADIPIEERYKLVKAYDESNTEAILLENLSDKGFYSVYRMDVMPLKFAELSIIQLAKFHSLGFVIQKKRQEYFDENIKILEFPVKVSEDYLNMKFIKRMYSCAVEGLDLERKSKLDEKLPVFLENYPKYFHGKMTKTKCLCHGDFRMNNIMVKNTENNISEVVPVDYQLIHYGSPIVDFIYFVYGATDRQFRGDHLSHLKNLYFDTMTKFLKNFEIDVNSVYSRKEFDKDFENCQDFGLMYGLFLLPCIFSREDSVPDFRKVLFENITVSLDKRYNDRLEGIMDDLCDCSYF